jgi:hypothetical protein
MGVFTIQSKLTTSHVAKLIGCVTFLVANSVARASAGADAESPSPSPVASAPATTSVLPKNFDPCGGPQELVKKSGISPCVAFPGEVILGGGYTSAHVDGSITPSGASIVIPAKVNAELQPQSSVIVGIAPYLDAAIVPPSYLQVTNPKEGTLLGGDADMSFSAQWLFSRDLKNHVLTSIGAGVEFPTGSPPLAAPAPVYSLQLIGSRGLPHGFGLTYELTAKNFEQNGSRTTTLSPTVFGNYLSPGGLLMAAGAIVLPNGKIPPFVQVSQLVGRHVQINILYAGFGTGLVNITNVGVQFLPTTLNVNGSTNVVGASIALLIGRSGP